MSDTQSELRNFLCFFSSNITPYTRILLKILHNLGTLDKVPKLCRIFKGKKIKELVLCIRQALEYAMRTGGEGGSKKVQKMRTY